MTQAAFPKLLRRPDVESMTGLKRSSIYNKLNPKCKHFDPAFPRPINLSASDKGSVAWIASEIIAWIEIRIEASRPASSVNEKK